MYRNMAKYYDFIFPSEGKYRFLTRLLAAHKKDYDAPETRKLLDIGCSNGRLACMLAEDGYDVTAFDLSSAMIDEAVRISENRESKPSRAQNGETKQSRAQNGKGRLKLLELDMLDVAEAFEPENFDLAYCVGNTLVHLEDDATIQRALRGFAQVLKPRGTLVIQILPYARILKKRPPQLPLIENEVLRFERFYEYIDESSEEDCVDKDCVDKDCVDGTAANQAMREPKTHIRFRTRLTLKCSDEAPQEGLPQDGLPQGAPSYSPAGETIWEGSERLYPITEKRLTDLLENAGFQVVETYGNFAGEPQSEDTPALILVCERRVDEPLSKGIPSKGSL